MNGALINILQGEDLGKNDRRVATALVSVAVPLTVAAVLGGLKLGGSGWAAVRAARKA